MCLKGIEQLSFLKPIEKPEVKNEIYGAAICYRCCCNKCIYNVEIYPFLNPEECKTIKDDSCFNCDECYFYSMDNDNLSRNRIKFECSKFKMSAYYSELEVKARRKKFKVI